MQSPHTQDCSWSDNWHIHVHTGLGNIFTFILQRKSKKGLFTRKVTVIQNVHSQTVSQSWTSIFKESFKDQRWAWEESVRAEKRDRDAEREKETFRRQRHHQSTSIEALNKHSTTKREENDVFSQKLSLHTWGSISQLCNVSFIEMPQKNPYRQWWANAGFSWPASVEKCALQKHVTAIDHQMFIHKCYPLKRTFTHKQTTEYFYCDSCVIRLLIGDCVWR